jgi:hypothetical protein
MVSFDLVQFNPEIPMRVGFHYEGQADPRCHPTFSSEGFQQFVFD